jgi:hypothetical protein
VAAARSVVTILHRDDTHAFSNQTVNHLGEVAIAARQSRQIGSQHHVDATRQGGLLQSQDTRPIADCGAADPLILESLNDSPPMPLGVFGADAHLVGD